MIRAAPLKIGRAVFRFPAGSFARHGRAVADFGRGLRLPCEILPAKRVAPRTRAVKPIALTRSGVRALRAMARPNDGARGVDENRESEEIAPQRCRSSVVEHSLGKGEVDSSILSGSTIKIP